MKQVKELLKKMFCLPPLLSVILAVPAFALVIYVLAESIDGPLAYLSYAVSSYALIVVLPGIFRAANNLWRRVNRHPLGKRLTKDARFRAELSLTVGFAINLLYIVIKMVSGIYYRSLWFVSLAIYYALLAVMRLSLLYPRRQADKTAELQRYRLCGIILLLMNLVLTGIVIFMVHQNRGYEYPGMLIYAMAAYSFYSVILATVNVVKFRKYRSPILSAAKAINLVAAMVSILSLETAMMAQFGGDDDPLFRKAMTGATGGGVCVIVLGMAIYMIVKSTQQLKGIK
ncbi:MAG: hypothetical protein K2O18_09990 [Oscillospiraceae bacterium]|nr:hypothetical protein [Oscillospiraceae bacterium]